MTASPGGNINAFCEPTTTTSRPHSSTGTSYTPTAVIASTHRMTSSFPFTTFATASTSCLVAVDVSDAVAYTARTPGLSSIACATTLGSTPLPHSTSMNTQSMP